MLDCAILGKGCAEETLGDRRREENGDMDWRNNGGMDWRNNGGRIGELMEV